MSTGTTMDNGGMPISRARLSRRRLRNSIARTVAGLALGAVVIGACASAETGLDDLDGTYESTAVTGHTLVGDTVIELVFDGDRLSAWAGCNRLGTTFDIDDDVLVTGEFQSTRMACEPELMEQDTWLAAFLGSRPRLAFDPELVISGSVDDDAVEVTLAVVADGSSELD